MKRILPGFPLTLGYTIFYRSVVVLLPFAALFAFALGITGSEPGDANHWAHFWRAISSPRVVASYKVSFGCSLAAALINGVFGFITAWTLVRYRFPGRRFLDGLIDLPFALPTAVAGISLTAIYAQNGWVGYYLKQWFGWKVAYTHYGIIIALTFIGFPFVVRTLQPVLQALSDDVEEAAATLGASRWQTFRRVIFPAALPALLTGMTLAFGRAVGEYGSIVFISGNLPMKTEITPLQIVIRLEENDYRGAAAIGLVMLLISVLIVGLVNAVQVWNHRRTGGARIQQ
mgnify:CR=1 FL=1